MTVLWRAFSTAPGLAPIGRLTLRHDIVHRPAIRLRIAEHVTGWPETLAHRPPHQPIFVAGLPPQWHHPAALAAVSSARHAGTGAGGAARSSGILPAAPRSQLRAADDGGLPLGVTDLLLDT
ncbi:hypothetical protein GCM10020220_068820 [Nonomuraea rubra]